MSKWLEIYIKNASDKIKEEDGNGLCQYITINPGVQEGNSRARFPECTDFDLFSLPDRFRDVLRHYLKMMKAVYVNNDINGSFESMMEMVNSLNRAAEWQTNWINRPLIMVTTELISLYKVKMKNFPETDDASHDSSGEFEKKASTLERLADTLHRLFRLALNDKNPDLAFSKRVDIYFFLGNLIRMYFNLDRLELANSIEKALRGTRFQLPELSGALPTKKGAITYLYYSSLLSLDDGEFSVSEKKLEKAIELTSCYSDPQRVKKQTEKLLLVYLPLKFYNARLMPGAKVWQQFPNLALIYQKNLFKALYEGNLKLYDESLSRFQLILLKRHLYLLFELLRSLCFLQLIRRTVHILKPLSPDSTKSHIVPLSAIQLSLEIFSAQGPKEFRPFLFPINSVECLLANLIAEGKIKAYISHANHCLVLSKTNPFPKQVIVNS